MKVSQFVVFTLILFMGCTTQSVDLEQAQEVHLEAMEIAKVLRSDLTDMKSDSTQVVKADSLLNILNDWQAGVAEVPGFPHVHEEGHSHNHIQVRDSEQLNHQKQSLAAIKELKNSL